jgi:hypothetical protein
MRGKINDYDKFRKSMPVFKILVFKSLILLYAQKCTVMIQYLVNIDT